MHAYLSFVSLSPLFFLSRQAFYSWSFGDGGAPPMDRIVGQHLHYLTGFLRTLPAHPHEDSLHESPRFVQ
jgi:hypothetical protein